MFAFLQDVVQYNRKLMIEILQLSDSTEYKIYENSNEFESLTPSSIYTGKNIADVVIQHLAKKSTWKDFLHPGQQWAAFYVHSGKYIVHIMVGPHGTPDILVEYSKEMFLDTSPELVLRYALPGQCKYMYKVGGLY